MTIINCPPNFYNKFKTIGKSKINTISISNSEEEKNTEKISKNKLEIFIAAQKQKLNILNIDLTPTQKEIQIKEAKTEEIKELLKFGLETLEFGSDDDPIFDKLINKYCQKKNDYLKQNFPEIYEEGLKYKEKMYPNQPKNDFYYELDFEDLLLIICDVIKYYTKINIHLELGDLKTNVFMIVYGDEKIYEKLSFLFQYELQLKPYALKYEYYRRELEKVEKLETGLLTNQHKILDFSNEDEKYKANYLNNAPEGAFQFEELHFSYPYLWPPYVEYNEKFEKKFRRYEKNDDFHQCDFVDEEFVCDFCSKFRNIDKLRLLYDSLDKCLNFTYLKKQKIINTFIFKRNYISYHKKITLKNMLQKSYKIFYLKDFLYLINLVRNYFGEEFAFYFIWLEHYIQWLIAPGLIGIIVTFFIYFERPFKNNPIGSTPITSLDIFLLIFTVFVIIWATLFLKTWKQKEKKYSFIFGTENYISNEPDSELFNPDYEIEFVLGKKISLNYTYIYNIKKLFSYFVLILMISSTCAITYLLFYYKKSKLKPDTKENYYFNTGINILYACINSIQIQIFHFIYKLLATKLNKWENYKKDKDRLNDLSVKIIIFDFMNSYSSCFYIGFVKPALNEECTGTCINELETQLYTTYAVYFALNFVEIFMPYFWFKYNEYYYKKNSIRVIHEIQMHSILYQQLCSEEENLIYEYNEMIILFGYVCLFSVTAPLTPLIIMILIWMEKILDIIKIFFFTRVSNINKATGIEIYNDLAKILMFIGMLTNAGILMFSKEFKMNNKMVYKLWVFLGVENVMLILQYAINYNLLPKWFDEERNLKELYEKKYLKKKGSLLPHNFLIVRRNKIELNRKKTLISNYEGNKNKRLFDEIKENDEINVENFNDKNFNDKNFNDDENQNLI